MDTLIIKRNYLFKVWGSTIIAAPVLIMLLTSQIMTKQGNGLDSGAFEFIAFSIGYGLLLSIPTFLIIYFLFPQINKRFDNPIHLKIILTAIGISCILITFYLLYGSDAYNFNGNYAALTFSIVYSICLTFFSFIYPLQSNQHSL
jgi:multisubunit Na+/H+ antiporter MnhC subunit